MAGSKSIKALVVDDAAFMRKQLVEILSSTSDIEVVAVARHGLEALEAIKTLKPDVVTLDVDMPVMDGLTTIKHIMIRSPLPVVMISGLADQGKITFEALRLGAIDFFPKPSGTISKDISNNSHELIQVLKIAAKANPRAIKRALIGHADRPLETKHCSKGHIGVLLVIARQGAVSSFVRLFSAIAPLKNLVTLCVQDISTRVLQALGQEMGKYFDCKVFSKEEVSPGPGTCVLLSEEGLPHPKVHEDGLKLELPTTRSGDLNGFMTKLAKEIGSNLLVVVLGGQTQGNIHGFEIVREKGGQIITLSPDKCPCSELPRAVVESGLGQVAPDEYELWDKIRAFSRKLTLEARRKQEGIN